MSVTDSRKKSISEALLNSFGSYPIGYAIGIVILPLSVGWIEKDPFTVNLFITLVYAAVSFVRTYFLRRLFDKFGFDDNFVRLGYKGFALIFSRMQKYIDVRQVVGKFKGSISGEGKFGWKNRLFMNGILK